jgi:hypothetical protein
MLKILKNHIDWKRKQRNLESVCLLCKKERASQRNSHIFPKFLTKSLHGNQNKKASFIIGTNTTHLPPHKRQDTDKADYILCSKCESFFSILETYVSSSFHLALRNEKYAADFTSHKSEEGVTWKVCERMDQQIFRLFLYSVIWRSSISNTIICKDFSLNPNEEELLREVLSNHVSVSKAELDNKLKFPSREFPLVTFFMFTAESFGEMSRNTIFVHPGLKNPYWVVLNEYILYFSFNDNVDQARFGFLNNSDASKIKIGVFPLSFWEGQRKMIFNMLAEDVSKHLQRTKQIPWVIKQEQLGRGSQ